MPPASRDDPCPDPSNPQMPNSLHTSANTQLVHFPDSPNKHERDCGENPINTAPSRPNEPTERGHMSALGPSSCLSPGTQDLLNKAGSSFTTNQHQSTPYAAKMSEALKPNPNRDEHKKLIKLELGPLIALNDQGDWAKSLYKNLVSKAEIDRFLADSGLYKSKRWTTILNPTKEADLYGPFVVITNAILKRFVLKVCKEDEFPRKAIDTNVKNLPHQEETKTKLWSRPDISIKGEGSSFQVPEEDAEGETAEVGFSNMLSFEEIKLDKAKGSPAQQGLQVGVYVRQIFIHQPNRKFVRALVLTETSVRLYHFDRSGGMYTSYINIHKHPHTFVRLVVGLNSLDESAIGFDVSIKWTIEDGRKVGGTLTTMKKDKTEIKYILSEVDPVITFFDIRGRGTQCWNVSDPTTGDKLLVKDCWRAEDRVPEYEHLEELRGVQGVAQMLSFEPNRGETKDFRATRTTSHQEFQNRVAVRIVMNSYGESIESFKSPKELLCALRDAIKGHMNLYKTQRLHRDVTIHNVLIGKKPDGSEPDPGYCGILIDLYMAIQSERLTLSAEQRSASRLFLSVVLLKSCNDPMDNEDEDDEEEEEEEQVLQLAHDHLDDLEAFFYIYTYILNVYDGSGASYKVPPMMKKWERDVPSAVRDSKQIFLAKQRTGNTPFRRRWPDECIELLDEFRKFIFPHVVRKIDIMENADPDNDTEVEYMKGEIDKHYDTVLHIFNKAIEGLGEHQPGLEKDISANGNRFTTPPRDLDSAAPYPCQNPLKRMGGHLGELPWVKRGPI